MPRRSPVAEVARDAAPSPAAPELVETLADGRLRCLRLRAPLSDPGGPRGRLPGALPQERRAPSSARLRRRAPVRPDREEAVLPRASRLRRALLRDARLRPALRATARTGSRRSRSATRRRSAPRATSRRRSSSRSRRRVRRPDDRLDLQRAAHHVRVGGRGLSRGEGDAGCAPRTSPTATARRRSSTTSGPGSTSTRWT